MNVIANVSSFLVIGGGSIGKRHLRNLKALGATRLSAFDVRDDRRREVADTLGVEAFSDLDDALAAGPAVAFVCSPTSLHLDHALRAARRGCHLFIEKPIASTLDGVDALVGEVEQRGLRTLVGCNFRFHPGLQHVKLLLESGVIGTVVSARAIFGQYLPDWHPWEDYRRNYSAQSAAGGGVVLDRIHELDYLYWLLGDVTGISAMMGHLSSLEIDTEDVADMLLQFASGAIGTVHVDYVSRSYDCRLEIVGEQGSIAWSFQGADVRWFTASEQRWQSLSWPRYDVNRMYVDQLQHFLDVLDGRTTSINDVRSARRVLAVALAAKQAAESGRRVTP